MSDRFVPIPIDRLASWIFGELRARGSIMGVPRELFWEPVDAPFGLLRHGARLETPIGVAAGPHTQLAQNLVMAWLMGARFLELKTVQTLDEIEVSKPCIDAEDVGFNCEWSQELRLEESFQEYLAAWVLIHALRAELGWGRDPGAPGFVLNMSVGYNLEGILKPNVQAFLDRMADAGDDLARVQDAVSAWVPGARDLAVPSRISDNVTLSTMHGCPPDEIERIALYLIQERGLHTVVKVNPTLLGPDRLRALLHDRMGFSEIVVPDVAFEHDLKWDDAVPMIWRLSEAARERGVDFGLKLTNTLEVANHRQVFSRDQRMMYMSGRALHALTLTLGEKLLDELEAKVPISVCGGVDAFALPGVLAAGMAPVTMCTDLLKRGGYLRLPQYLSQLGEAMKERGAGDLDQWAAPRGARVARPGDLVKTARRAVGAAIESPRFRRRVRPVVSKGRRPLGWFDCIAAPCQEACPAGQNIPDYMYLVAAGRPGEALQVIRDTNPLPNITGAVCDHPCVTRCVRNHYDDPLAIREIKRFAAACGEGGAPPAPAPEHGRTVAVIGAGPAGLTAAYLLRLDGYQVTVIEAREGPGGMVAWAIPAFRLTEEEILADLTRIQETGVSLRYGEKVGAARFVDLRREHDHVVVATGAPRGRMMSIPGERSHGVFDGVGFLEAVRRGAAPETGGDVIVVGGGNAAMDAARTAWRLPGTRKVTVLYRRTRAEMPADPDEIQEMLDEGCELHELAMPARVSTVSGRVESVTCVRMTLSEPDASGRPRPVPVEGSELVLPCSTMVVCVSQKPEIDFVSGAGVQSTDWGTLMVDPETMETTSEGIFAAGDVVRGPATIIQAVADGRRVADAIRRRDGRQVSPPSAGAAKAEGELALLGRRAQRRARTPLKERPAGERRDFQPVVAVLDAEQAQQEASRCLLCNEMCSICVTVCPNRANQVYRVAPRTMTAPDLWREGDSIVSLPGEPLKVEQSLQIVNLADICNECGNCVTFCPTAGRPFADKPRLHLAPESYREGGAGALHLVRLEDGYRLRVRLGDREIQIEREGSRIQIDEEEAGVTAVLEGGLGLPGGLSLAGATVNAIELEEWRLDGRELARLLVVADGLLEALGPLLPGAQSGHE